MHPTTLKLATWNIGGGILGESHQRDATPSLEYYAQVLADHAPDVVCLQEAHWFTSGAGQSEYLASQAGYAHVLSFPMSESHMAAGARLSLGILSRYPIKTTTYEQFPNPGLTAAGPDGRDWKLLDKGYVKAVIEAHDRYLGVLNAHCFPLHYFGAEPTEPRFTDMWRMLATDLLEMHDATPTLAGMDLNYAPIDDLLGELLRAGSYGNAFEGTPTTAKGIQQDYILYDRRMVLLQTTVSPTKSDHSYCQVEIVLP